MSVPEYDPTRFDDEDDDALAAQARQAGGDDLDFDDLFDELEADENERREAA